MILTICYFILVFLGCFIVIPILKARDIVSDLDDPDNVIAAFLIIMVWPIALIALGSKFLFNLSVRIFTPKSKIDPTIDEGKSSYRKIKYHKTNE